MKLRSNTMNSRKIKIEIKTSSSLNAIAEIVAENEKENEYYEKCISSLLHSANWLYYIFHKHTPNLILYFAMVYDDRTHISTLCNFIHHI